MTSAHIGHVELLTPRPAESLEFFTAAERKAGVGWGTKFPETRGSYGTPAD